jgi:hypothetical protein
MVDHSDNGHTLWAPYDTVAEAQAEAARASGVAGPFAPAEEGGRQ